jgi:hypothetical protein
MVPVFLFGNEIKESEKALDLHITDFFFMSEPCFPDQMDIEPVS